MDSINLEFSISSSDTEMLNLIPIRILQEPYESYVEYNGFSYHIIFGSQSNGHFICIPNFGVGCELSHYDDIFWNRSSLLNTSGGTIDYAEANAIAHAVKYLNGMIN